MRIISQNGRIDVSYESSVICVREVTGGFTGGFGFEIAAFIGNNAFGLGKYESEERAKEVMGKVRSAYLNDAIYLRMPKE